MKMAVKAVLQAVLIVQALILYNACSAPRSCFGMDMNAIGAISAAEIVLGMALMTVQAAPLDFIIMEMAAA